MQTLVIVFLSLEKEEFEISIDDESINGQASLIEQWSVSRSQVELKSLVVNVTIVTFFADYKTIIT